MHPTSHVKKFSRNMECFLRTPSFLSEGVRRWGGSDESAGRQTVMGHDRAKRVAGTVSPQLTSRRSGRVAVERCLEPVGDGVPLPSGLDLGETTEHQAHSRGVEHAFRHTSEAPGVAHRHRQKRTDLDGCEFDLHCRRQHIQLDRLDEEVDRVHGRGHAIVDGVLGANDHLLRCRVRLTEHLSEHCFRVFHYSRFLSSKRKKSTPYFSKIMRFNERTLRHALSYGFYYIIKG